MLAIELTGKNLEITEPLNKHVHEKFKKLSQYSDSITSIHVVLDIENQRKSRNASDKDEPQQIASAKLHISGSDIYAKSESGDMYKSVDLLVAKLVSQLKKTKEKKNHH